MQDHLAKLKLAPRIRASISISTDCTAIVMDKLNYPSLFDLREKEDLDKVRNKVHVHQGDSVHGDVQSTHHLHLFNLKMWWSFWSILIGPAQLEILDILLIVNIRQSKTRRESRRKACSGAAWSWDDKLPLKDDCSICVPTNSLSLVISYVCISFY